MIVNAEMIKEAFPWATDADIVKVLEETGGDCDRTLDMLQNMEEAAKSKVCLDKLKERFPDVAEPRLLQVSNAAGKDPEAAGELLSKTIPEAMRLLKERFSYIDDEKLWTVLCEKGFSFERAVESLRPPTPNEQTAAAIKDVFKKYDTNGDGCLSKDELFVIMAKLNNGFKEADLDIMLLQMDTNHDGIISVDEFIEYTVLGKLEADIRDEWRKSNTAAVELCGTWKQTKGKKDKRCSKTLKLVDSGKIEWEWEDIFSDGTDGSSQATWGFSENGKGVGEWMLSAAGHILIAGTTRSTVNDNGVISKKKRDVEWSISQKDLESQFSHSKCSSGKKTPKRRTGR